MFGFWAVAAVFVIVAFALLLPPLFRKQDSSKVVARRDLTVTVYQDQFNELENDLKNQVISEDQYGQAKIDLEKSLLLDIGKAEKIDDQEKSASAPMSNKISAVLIALIIPVISLSLYDRWGGGVEAIDPESIPEEVRIAKQKHNQEESIENMLLQLKARLQEDPTDGEGWFMLARTYRFMKRYADAVDAFEKSLPLGGDQSADILSSYADAIAMASNRTLTKKAVNVLKQALEIDPKHVKSLWLVGTAAYQNKELKEAKAYWERLHAVLPPGSDDANQIAMNINEVRALLGMPEVEIAPAVATNPVANVDARIRGSVTLSGTIAAKASPDDTVFVFARAANGPRMPLAIIRKQVKDIPFDFSLDDSLAMNESMKISSFENVVIGARISKTGNAMPQPGDLQGTSEIVSVAENKAITIVIKEVVN